MLRSTATRSLLKSFSKAPVSRYSYSAASSGFRNAKSFQQLRRPQALAAIFRPTTTSLLYATKTPFDPISPKAERKSLEQNLEQHPEAVSLDSSVRHIFTEEGQAPVEKKEDDMLAGIKADLITVKETFSLHEVPKESLYIGAAGILPYAATSLSTVFLAYDINHAHDTGSGILFSPETAHQLLDLVTPVQIAYGAVIISFLGAIHWGLEYAGYGGYHSYRRYMIGVIAPAIAWPTMFMPIEYALISQFLAFNFLYFTDARATSRGWFPAWYSTYRFVLTFFVGASIVVSLIGRGQIVSHDGRLSSSTDYIKGDRDQQWIALEKEEKERRAKMVAEDAAKEEDEGEDDEGKDSGEDQDDSELNGDDKKDEE